MYLTRGVVLIKGKGGMCLPKDESKAKRSLKVFPRGERAF